MAVPTSSVGLRTDSGPDSGLTESEYLGHGTGCCMLNGLIRWAKGQSLRSPCLVMCGWGKARAKRASLPAVGRTGLGTSWRLQRTSKLYS